MQKNTTQLHFLMMLPAYCVQELWSSWLYLNNPGMRLLDEAQLQRNDARAKIFKDLMSLRGSPEGMKSEIEQMRLTYRVAKMGVIERARAYASRDVERGW